MDKAAEIEKLELRRIELLRKHSEGDKKQKEAARQRLSRITEKLRKLTRNNIYR